MEYDKRTCEIGSNVDCVSEVQAEDYSLVLIWRATTFAFLELLAQVITCENAAEDTSQP